jgi:hypothetical protein
MGLAKATVLICAALALLPAQAFALTLKCNHYEALGTPSIKLEETETAFRVQWEGSETAYMKTMIKVYGVLVDAGFRKVDGVEETHAFRHDALSGIDVIISDGVVFMPVCYAWDAKAPKPELAPDKLWFLSKKKWP